MTRIARIVVPGVAHHVVQRGNRRQQTFFFESDYARYAELVANGYREAKVSVLAWCLMPNHSHLILVPQTTDGLGTALSSAHQRYTWLVNRRNGWTGHLWQSRFHSCPMDDAHLIAAIRYVELNPVRARMVGSPELWRWSSVAGRLGRRDELGCSPRPEILAHVEDWRAFLADGLTDEEAETIRSHVRKGAALGGPGFVSWLESRTGRSLRRSDPGRAAVAGETAAGPN